MKTTAIKYIILFITLIFIIDFGLGKIISKNIKNIKYGDYSFINNSLKSNAEILILGSSRAVHHYNPNILSNTLNLSCINAGFGGHGVFLNYAILKENIKINNPKIVIIDLSPNIIVDKESYSKLNILLPYYKGYPAFKEIINLNPKFSKLELVSNLYIYNSTLYDFSRSYYKESNEHSGFYPLEGEINKENFTPVFLDNEKIDANKLYYLNKIINLCKRKNIRLIGITSPTYEKFDQENRIINNLQTIFKNNGVEYYDFSNSLKLYQKSEYFKDQLHLNNLGADIFSTDIVKIINNNGEIY